MCNNECVFTAWEKETYEVGCLQFELCMVPCSNCAVFFPERRSNLRWIPVCTTSLSTISCVLAFKSRGFGPACLQHVMLPFWPPHLISCFKAIHSLSCICSFSSCRGGVFHGSPFISVNCFLSQRWFCGRLQMGRHLRTLASIPLQCPLNTMTVPLVVWSSTRPLDLFHLAWPRKAACYLPRTTSHCLWHHFAYTFHRYPLELWSRGWESFLSLLARLINLALDALGVVHTGFLTALMSVNRVLSVGLNASPMRWIIQYCHELRCCHRLPLCGSIRSFWTDASARACVCHQTCVARWNRRCESHASSLSQSSATHLRSHRCVDLDTCTWWFFFWHVALSRETLSRSHLPTAHPLLCYSVGILQSLVSHLHRPRSSVLSCSGTSHDLPLCNSNTFSDSRLSLYQTIRSLRPCNACSLSMLFGCTPICTGTRLLSMYCCVLVISRFSFRICVQLVIAFPDDTSLQRPSSILNTFTSTLMSSQSLMSDSRVRVLHPLGKTTRSTGVQQTSAPILSRTASFLRIPRSRLPCDTCTMSPSSRVCCTSACWASCWVSVSTILLSLSVPARSAGPRLRDHTSDCSTDAHVSSVLHWTCLDSRSLLCRQLQRLFLCGGRRGILDLLHKLISLGWEDDRQHLLEKLHIQLLDGHCHLFLWSRHGCSSFTVGTRCFPPCSTLCPRLVRARPQSLSDCFVFSLDRLDTSVPGALRSTLKRPDSELSKKNGGIIRPKGIFSKYFGPIHLAGLRGLKHFFFHFFLNPLFFHLSLCSSCLFSCLACSLFLSSLFSSLLFSSLLSPLSSFLAFLSCLFFSCLVLSLSLSLSLSFSLCLRVMLCVVLCGVCRWWSWCCWWSWCVFGVRVARHTETTWKNLIWLLERLRVYIQNVSVFAGTTCTCVETCARGAGTHGEVLSVHTGRFWIHTRGTGGHRQFC